MRGVFLLLLCIVMVAMPVFVIVVMMLVFLIVSFTNIFKGLNILDWILEVFGSKFAAVLEVGVELTIEAIIHSLIVTPVVIIRLYIEAIFIESRRIMLEI